MKNTTQLASVKLATERQRFSLFARYSTTEFSPISVETVKELMRRRLFHLCDAEHWRLGDEHNGCTRRLDGGKWKRHDHSGPAWHRLIGLEDVTRHNRQLVLFVIEGSKDALAGAELARRFGDLPQTGIVCALGSGYRPERQPREIKQLRGRQVLLIGDNDAAGRDATLIVSAALDQTAVTHTIWNWSAWTGKAKDIYGLLLESPESAKQMFDLCNPTFSPLSLPSQSSSVQEFKSSCNIEPPGLSKEEVLGIIYPFVVTEQGTGNRQSFLLARAIKPRRQSNAQIDYVLLVWFEESRSLLPADATYENALRKFYRQLTRVRFTESGLEAAWGRAQSAEPPFIASWDGDNEIALLASFCRELQRNARDRAFICPVHVVQRLFNLRWPVQATRLLQALEDEDVIKCVDRGAPHLPGKKGKPTLWRYLFSVI
jgi:Toprim-like